MKDYHVNVFFSEEDDRYIADIPIFPTARFWRNAGASSAEVLKAKLPGSKRPRPKETRFPTYLPARHLSSRQSTSLTQLSGPVDEPTLNSEGELAVATSGSHNSGTVRTVNAIRRCRGRACPISAKIIHDTRQVGEPVCGPLARAARDFIPVLQAYSSFTSGAMACLR